MENIQQLLQLLFSRDFQSATTALYMIQGLSSAQKAYSNHQTIKIYDGSQCELTDFSFGFKAQGKSVIASISFQQWGNSCLFHIVTKGKLILSCRNGNNEQLNYVVWDISGFSISLQQAMKDIEYTQKDEHLLTAEIGVFQTFYRLLSDMVGPSTRAIINNLD